MSAATFVIDHGDEVEDQITGFRGVVTGRTGYITGCNVYLVQPRVSEDGVKREPHWVDEDRLTVIERAKVTLRPAAERASALRGVLRRTGGDVAAPTR